jgi:hypothetical protein
MKAAENRRMTDLIHEVNIPMETVTEITDAGEKTVERKVFPGYVLVKMILTDDSWHLIHNVRGATGFVGSDGKAVPLTEQEIYDLGVERKEIVVGYGLGDEVKVIDGPLAGFFGIVDELEPKPGIAPSPAHLAQVIGEMKTNNAKVILVQPFQNRKTAETVARQTGAAVIDAPQQPGTSGRTASWFDNMDNLVRAIATGLGAQK